MAASFVSMDNGCEGIPETEMPVWILGKSYSALYGKIILTFLTHDFWQLFLLVII